MYPEESRAAAHGPAPLVCPARTRAQPQYWTTTDRPATEQFDYWQEVVCEAFTPLVAQRDVPGRSPDRAGDGRGTTG